MANNSINNGANQLQILKVKYQKSAAFLPDNQSIISCSFIIHIIINQLLFYYTNNYQSAGVLLNK